VLSALVLKGDNVSPLEHTKLLLRQSKVGSSLTYDDLARSMKRNLLTISDNCIANSVIEMSKVIKIRAKMISASSIDHSVVVGKVIGRVPPKCKST
jgi:hypothetical protein